MGLLGMQPSRRSIEIWVASPIKRERAVEIRVVVQHGRVQNLKMGWVLTFCGWTLRVSNELDFVHASSVDCLKGGTRDEGR